jgi:hypothetical protein
MITAFQFGLHDGHLTLKAQLIAERHDADHVNYTEPNGRKRGWFVCDNRGSPFNEARAKRVLADIEDAGGFKALTKGNAR